MKIHKVRDGADRVLYQSLTERWLGIRFPLEYLENASVFLARDNCGVPVGGFCIQSKPPFRVLESLPTNLNAVPARNTVELTGLWFQPSTQEPKGRIRFWFMLCSRFYRLATKKVVFAYSDSKPGLARTYSNAKPKVLFAGVTRIQPGMTEAEAEVVCVARGYRIALLPVFRPQFFLKRLRPRRACVS